MKLIKTLLLGILSTFGGILIVLGEQDDSPGLGGIGIILSCVSMYFNYKLYKK